MNKLSKKQWIMYIFFCMWLFSPPILINIIITSLGVSDIFANIVSIIILIANLYYIANAEKVINLKD